MASKSIRFSFLKILFYLLVLVFFLEVLLIGSQFLEQEDSMGVEKTPVSMLADQTMQRVHLVEGSGSSKDWELFADTAEGFLGQGSWNLTSVRVVFYAATGDTYVVSGDQGQIDTVTKNIDISGRVSTQSTNGYEFKTTTLAYRSENKTLFAPETLILKGPRDKMGYRLNLKGRGITTFLSSSLMNIESDVVADRYLSSGKKLTIKSKRAQLSGRTNMVRFSDSVRMVYDNYVIQGPEALFSYRTGDNVPQSIIVNGGVQVTDAEKKALAENLEIDVAEDRYIFKGSPRVMQGEDELKGEIISFYEGGKRIKVENIRAKKYEVEGEK